MFPVFIFQRSRKLNAFFNSILLQPLLKVFTQFEVFKQPFMNVLLIFYHNLFCRLFTRIPVDRGIKRMIDFTGQIFWFFDSVDVWLACEIFNILCLKFYYWWGNGFARLSLAKWTYLIVVLEGLVKSWCHSLYFLPFVSHSFGVWIDVCYCQCFIESWLIESEVFCDFRVWFELMSGLIVIDLIDKGLHVLNGFEVAKLVGYFGYLLVWGENIWVWDGRRLWFLKEFRSRARSVQQRLRIY